ELKDCRGARLCALSECYSNPAGACEMKVSVLQEQLARGLSIISRAVDPRNNLPVLTNVLLATEDARLKLAATNLQMSITTYIGAKVDKEGAITLPAKTLTELVNNLSPERVDLTLDAGTQTVN